MQALFANIAHHLPALLTWPVFLQLLLLAAIAVVALWSGRRIRASDTARAIALRPGFGSRCAEGIVIVSPFGLALLLAATALGVLYALRQGTNLLSTSLTLLALLLAIRIAVYILRVSVGNHAPIKGWGNTITWIVWAGWSLHVLGWLQPLVNSLDSIGIQAGSTRISVWSVVKLLITVTAFILFAIWVARWVEQRIMGMRGVAISMRIGLAKFIQAFLVGLSLLLGLNAAGLDLTTLTVLTGAIGIGLGFGLQAIAANFVSGFVLLMDRSIKPGDVISLSSVTGSSNESFGWVQELRGRYVVLRDRDGVETLVPNQHLITNPVVNWSYTDPRVRMHLAVRVSYRSDPELALRLLIEATQQQDRILQEPPAVSRLMSFGDSGFELELRFWISDPQEGVNNVRSDVNRAIWRLFSAHGIVIPVTQSEVAYRVQSGVDRLP
jgi:small-conductance mechanosensitive channel